MHDDATDDVANTKTVRDAPKAHTHLADALRTTVPGHPRAGPIGSTHIEPGMDIGRYQIIALIGEGGMGRVLRAHDHHLGRDVAIKVVNRPTAHARARLLREARALAKISHPNVVPVFDVDTIGDDVYIAMELVDGSNAEQWLQTPRRWQEILEVFLDAGRGLRAVHAAGLVHRDFKPRNVVIGSDGRARVTDFGVAMLEGNEAEREDFAEGTVDRARLTVTGAILGTPAYMSPEQFLAGDIDHRSDQFGFCVSLFEGLFGAHPFEGTTNEQLFASITKGEVRKVVGSDAPGALLAILLRGLEADPGKRWPGMNELLAALTACRDRPDRKRVVFAAVSILVGLGVGAFAVWAAWPASAPTRSANPPVAANRPPAVSAATRLTAGGACEEYPTFSPDGRTIAFDGDALGDWEVFTIDRDTKQQRRVTHQPGWDYQARFSPDGARVAYLHQDERGRELRVIRLDDPDLEPQSLGEGMGNGAHDWLDASTLISATPGGKLVRIGLDGKRVEHLRLSEPQFIAAVRHRRGDFGLITNPDISPRLYLIRDGAAPRELTPERTMSFSALSWSPRGDGLYFKGSSALGLPTILWRAFDASEAVPVDSPPPGEGLDVARDGTAMVISTCRIRSLLVRLRPDRPPEPLFQGHDWDESDPVLLPDGRMMITSSRNAVAEVFLVDVATGNGSSMSPRRGRQAAVSPAGDRYIYTISGAQSGNGIWIAELAGGAHRQLTTDRTDREPMFAHDGAAAYFLRGDGDLQQVYRVPVEGGEAVPVTPADIVTFAVSPTADQLVYVMGPPNVGRLYRGPGAGPFTPITALQPARYSVVRFSPDGERLVVRREPNELVELTATGANARVVRSAPDVLANVIYAPDGDGFLGTIQLQTGNLFVLEGSFP